MEKELTSVLIVLLIVLLILFIIYMLIQKTDVCSIVRNEREYFGVGAGRYADAKKKVGDFYAKHPYAAIGTTMIAAPAIALGGVTAAGAAGLAAPGALALAGVGTAVDAATMAAGYHLMKNHANHGKRIGFG